MFWKRESVVASVGTIKGENIWDRLERYWTCLQAGLDPSYASSRSNIDEDTLINLTTMTAKLERNLIAGLYEHQRGSMLVGWDSHIQVTWSSRHADWSAGMSLPFGGRSSTSRRSRESRIPGVSLA